MLHAGKFKFVSVSGGKENSMSIKMIQNLKQLEQLEDTINEKTINYRCNK